MIWDVFMLEMLADGERRRRESRSFGLHASRRAPILTLAFPSSALVVRVTARNGAVLIGERGQGQQGVRDPADAARAEAVDARLRRGLLATPCISPGE